MGQSRNSSRAIQLDGMRAISMMAICWDHWTPSHWTRLFPYEVFLFFFLVMTGYLITASLLKERERMEKTSVPWKRKALIDYQIRRGRRIMAPYYFALAIGFLVQAPDLWKAPLAYLFHLSNFHMATLVDWPSGSNHFWSLSMQQQFYLLWPFLVWFVPWRALPWCMIVIAMIGPLTRSCHQTFAMLWIRPEILTWASLDYFAIGSLLAWCKSRGISITSPLMAMIYSLAFLAYVVWRYSNHWGWDVGGLRFLQQSFLSMGLCGVLVLGIRGMCGNLGRFFESKFLQRIGIMSYGVYLFHNLAPLMVGKILPFLWSESCTGIGWDLFRMAIFAATTWLLTLVSWIWIEAPMMHKSAHRA